MSKPVTALLQKEMNRKEFLATLGFGMASVMGFSTILRLFTGKSFSNHLGANRVSLGYGSSPYGGSKD